MDIRPIGDPLANSNAVHLTTTNLMFGPVPLLRRTLWGIEPRPLEEISAILNLDQECGGLASRYRQLKILAKALHESDWVKAAVVFAQLRLPGLLDNRCIYRLRLVEAMLKANFNPAELRDEKGRWTTDAGFANRTDHSGSTLDVEDRDCTQVLAECRVECTDAYVDGTIRDFFGIRKCLRSCMNRNGCFDF